MIQRIQTVYMLLSAILLCFLLGIPYAEINNVGQLCVFDIKGITQDGAVVKDGIYIAILIALIVILQFVAIFKFKKRPLQVHILAISTFLMIGLTGLLFFFIHYGFDNIEVSYKMAMSFPVVAAILDFMAIRRINKDETLIRSIDRIR